MSTVYFIDVRLIHKPHSLCSDDCWNIHNDLDNDIYYDDENDYLYYSLFGEQSIIPEEIDWNDDNMWKNGAKEFLNIGILQDNITHGYFLSSF